MKNDIQVSVVLPAYLEEENLRLLLPRLHATMSKLGMGYEVIVVDTIRPMDNTAEVCGSCGSKYINRETDNSFGSAVRTGIRASSGAHILFMDADGSHPPEFIPNLLTQMEDYDVVIASRYVEGGYTENSRMLVLMSKILNVIYARVLNIKCRDVSNSFKLYRAELLKDLKLYSSNFDIVEEIIYKICKKNKSVRIREIPFSFKKRMFGDTKRNLVLFIITYLITLLKLRFGR